MTLVSLPPEVFELIVVYVALSEPSELLASVNALQRSCKLIHQRTAVSSIFNRHCPFVLDPGYDSAAFTNPTLWAAIYKSLFSYSAVARRNFTPSPAGYTSQLLIYCSVIKRLAQAKRTGFSRVLRDDDALAEDPTLETILLMLLECDGKNTVHLDRVGAYDYCLAWLKHYLFQYNDDGISEWPRDDRFVAYALTNTWLLTTADRVLMESPQESVLLRDMLFRFTHCAWKYPQSYAPLHRYTLPIQHASHDGQPIQNRSTQFSIGASPHYPNYRGYGTENPCLNTELSYVEYYGATLPWTPPLLANSAKKLCFVRSQMMGLRSDPAIIPRDRQDLLARRQQEISQRLEQNPALAALYNLVETLGLGPVYHMIHTRTLPHHILLMDGLEAAQIGLDSIVNNRGANPATAVGPTIEAVEEWNSRLEVTFPVRGGWNEDGIDVNNRQWRKHVAGAPSTEPPLIRGFRGLDLPWELKHISEVHDTFFWRLQLCGDPFDHRGHLGASLSGYDTHILQRASLGIALARLQPGRTWKPGLLNGLFQGRFKHVPEHWYMASFHSGTMATPSIGEDIQRTLNLFPFHFHSRLREHHLVHYPKTDSKIRRPQQDDLTDAQPQKLPISCDATTFPRRLSQAATNPPIEVFASSIAPEDDLLIDEGAHNAFLPSGFRYELSENLDGSETATFGWGPRGVPSSDRCTQYRTYVPGRESHDSTVCPRCAEERQYLSTIDHMRLRWEDRERNRLPTELTEDASTHAERLFTSLGLGTGPHPYPSSSPSGGNKQPAGGNMEEDMLDRDLDELDDDAIAGVRSHSPMKFQPCDGIMDIVLTGETDMAHGQAWNHYHFFGRVRLWDGLVCILRVPKNVHARIFSMLFYGYFESDLNFVGSWRMVVGDRMHGPWIVPTMFDNVNGVNGGGLLSMGGAGVLGDGIHVVAEGPFVMSRVVEGLSQ